MVSHKVSWPWTHDIILRVLVVTYATVTSSRHHHFSNVSDDGACLPMQRSIELLASEYGSDVSGDKHVSDNSDAWSAIRF